MKNLIITLPACRDLEAISDYFLASSVEAGDRFVKAFEQKCQHLARFPYIGKSYPQLKLNYNTLAKLRGFSCCRNIMNTTKRSKLGKNLG